MKSKDINFEYVEEFVDHILDRVVGNEGLFMSVVAKYDEMKEVVKNIMLYDDVNFEKLELTTPLVNEYEDEYVLELFYEKGNVEFNCMPLKVDGRYDSPTADEVYIFDDCKRRIVLMCDGSLVYVIHLYDEECDCDEGCDEKCPCNCHKEEKEIAPTEKSHYSINGKPVSKAEFDKKYTELQKKYEKNMRSILDDYCDFMDELNTFFARLW